MKLLWRQVPFGDGQILTSLTGREAARLRELAEGRRVLEIGSAYGYSALTMTQTAEHVLAVDPHRALPDSLSVMRANLTQHGCEDRVSIVLADSASALPALRHCRGRFDLVFIDGDHAEQAVTFDIACAWTLLTPGGTLACHDYGEESCPGVRTAIDRWGKPGRLEADTLWVTGR